MTEIIEPNPILVKYVKLSNSLWTEFDNLSQLIEKTKYVAQNEWHYIMSNLEQNIFLLKRLNQKKLLKSNIKICDAGIGLGSALFDIYLQSKEISEINFTFFGIEKQKKYLQFFNEHLKEFWNDEITLIESDILDCNFSNYDIVYSYSPFVNEESLQNYYNKLKNEIKPGSLIIENRERGLGMSQILEKIEGLEKIEIDDIFVFKKL